MGALTKATEAILTNIIARDVAAGVELARSLGYKMPEEFDVGVTFVHEPRNLVGRVPLGPPPDWPIRIRMRMGDATYDSLVTLPEIEQPQWGRYETISLADVSAKWEVAWIRIHSDALTLAHVWIDRHPEAAMDRPGDALSFLDLVKGDDAVMARWMAECRERSKRFKYTAGAGATLKDMTS